MLGCTVALADPAVGAGTLFVYHSICVFMALSSIHMKHRAHLGTLGLTGKIHFSEDMTVEEAASED